MKMLASKFYYTGHRTWNEAHWTLPGKRRIVIWGWEREKKTWSCFCNDRMFLFCLFALEASSAVFLWFLPRVLTENYYDGSLMEWTIHLFHLSDSKKSQIKLIRHDRREQARRINRQRRETKTFQSKKESRGNKDQSSSKSIAATVSGTSN